MTLEEQVAQLTADTSTLLNTVLALKALLDAALAAAQNAPAMLVEMEQRYLGDHDVDPTTDTLGNPLTTGAMYFNTTVDLAGIRVWDGAAWRGLPSMDQLSSANLAQYESKFELEALLDTFLTQYAIAKV